VKRSIVKERYAADVWIYPNGQIADRTTGSEVAIPSCHPAILKASADATRRANRRAARIVRSHIPTGCGDSLCNIANEIMGLTSKKRKL